MITYKIKSRFERAKKDCKRIVDYLISEFNPKRIYQWGSLVYPERFSEISDIDIAVEVDVPPEEFFRMLVEVDNMTDLPVDIVEIDKIHPHHADSIRKYGKLVYERK